MLLFLSLFMKLFLKKALHVKIKKLVALNLVMVFDKIIGCE